MTDPSMPVTLYAEFTEKPGARAALEDLIRPFAEQVRSEPGNVEFRVFRERDDDRKFCIIETYVNAEAFQTHINAPYGGPFNQALSGLIEEDGSQLTFLQPTDL